MPSLSPTGGSSVDIKKLASVGSSASLISARGHQESAMSSVSGSKDWSNLSVFSSFINNSIFPIEDLHNVAQALKPPEKMIPSSSQKGPTIFPKYQKKILIKFKGRTFIDIPYYPYVNDDAETESTTSKSPGPNQKKKPSSASGKRPGSSNSTKKGANNSAISTESNTTTNDDGSIQKLWEHRVVYFVASNYGGSTGFVELHQTLIDSQEYNIEKEHTIYMETLQDLVYFESCPFVSFVIRREFDPATPPTTVEKKKSSKKEATPSNAGNKKDNTPPAPGLPATNTTKKVQNNIGSATQIPLEELQEGMIADIKAAFGSHCEILHSYRASTIPLFVNDKFGYTKCKYEFVYSPKYKYWSSLLDTKSETASNGFDESFKSEGISSARFSVNALSFTPPQDYSEFLHNINIRFEVAEGASILSEDVQNKLNPMMVSISSLKDLPNESYLSDRCKPVSVSYSIRGKTFKTKGHHHDSLINLGYQRIIYLGNSNEMEMYRDYFIRMPIVFETHDRDPKDGIAKFFGKSEVALKTLILNSRGRDISDNFQIQGYTILPDEYEKAVKRIEEEKKKAQTQEEEKKVKPNTKSPKNLNMKSPSVESPKNSLNDSVFTVEYSIFEGKYVEKKSSIKIQLRFNTPFPQFTETEKSTYPIILTFDWENANLIQKTEQIFNQFFIKPMPAKSRSDLFGGMPNSGTMNGGGANLSPVNQFNTLSLSPESASSDMTPGGKNSGKDVFKHFCGFEICDGKKRLMVIEATSKDAFRYLTGHLEKYISKENQPVNIMYDPTYFYSNRLYEQLVLGPKSDRAEDKKPAGRSSVQIEIDQKKPIIRLRLQDTFENILSTKDMYIKNKKSEDVKILSALSKLNHIFMVDTINQVIENSLLPDSSLLMNIKERHCDDGLIEIDSIIANNQKKRQEEEQMHTKHMKDKVTEELYKSPQTVEDLALHLGEEIGFEGIPLIETPQHLPPPEKVLFEGEEKRKKNRIKNWKTNPSGFSLDEVSAPEKKYWLYIPHLKGHLIASFPPMAKELPPYNLHSYMTGVLVRSDRKHPPPKIRAYTAFGSPGTKNRKPEITISPDTIYCILVSSWTQRASTQVDNQLDSKIRQSLKRAVGSPGKNYIRGNFSTVRELSQQSSMYKQQEEVERSSKKFITVPTYPDQRKQTEKSIEYRNTAPPTNKPTWVKRGKTSSVEDNRHPKKPDQARIDELNMIDLFDKTLESHRENKSTLFSPRGVAQEVVPPPNPPNLSIKLPKLK